MSESVLTAIDRILDETAEADDALRLAVDRLAAAPGIRWAAVAFLEDRSLVVGPASGSPDPARRTRVPIAFGGDQVGELHVDGASDPELLALVAERLAPHVLIGWDTRGEPWEP